jgi:hypothetical protein
VTPEKKKLAVHMLDELKWPYKPLTTWEQRFVDSCEEQWEQKAWFSEKQMEILERIYAEKTN